MPLPLRFQWEQSGSNSTYQGWLEETLSKLQAEIEVEKITSANKPSIKCNYYGKGCVCSYKEWNIGIEKCGSKPCEFVITHHA